jgi:hypothetical protein
MKSRLQAVNTAHSKGIKGVNSQVDNARNDTTNLKRNPHSQEKKKMSL